MHHDFRAAIHRAIIEGHPLASELFMAWFVVTRDEDVAEFMTADLLWKHSLALDSDVHN